MQSVLLIHPPLVKPSEPPAGLARLAGALRRHNVPCTVVDANLEGLLYLLHRRAAGGSKNDRAGDDRWTKRACRLLAFQLNLLRSREGYDNMDRYKRAVLDINRVLARSVSADAFRLSLSDYEDRSRLPVRSADLISAAETPDDNPFHAYFHARFPALLEHAQPSWIGFSLNYLSQALCCFALIGFMRRIFPDAKMMLGGGLVSSWMQRPGWRNPFKGLIDACIAGPGEAPLLACSGVPWDGVPAKPDYSDFSLKDYLAPEFILPYSASSGCYWRRCAFCPETVEANPFRPIPDGRVADELARWTAMASGREVCNGEDDSAPTAGAGAAETVPSGKRKDAIVSPAPALIHLLDNAIRPSLMTKLSLNPPGVPWYGFARISKELTDIAFCRGLRRAGCVMLKLGIESGSQRVLDELGKGIDLGMAGAALETLHRAGIAAYVYLLFGTPPEKQEDALKTLDFVIRYEHNIDFLNVAIFNLPINSPEAEMLEPRAFYDGDLSLYRAFTHPSGWDRSRVRLFLDRIFKRHPAVAPILRRDPPFFTSNHAPFWGKYQK
jgi:hypothetical protein